MKVRKSTHSSIINLFFFSNIRKSLSPVLFSYSPGKKLRVCDFLNIFSNGYFMNSCADAITLISNNTPGPEALLLLRDLNAFENPSYVLGVSFNFVLTFTRYD